MPNPLMGLFGGGNLPGPLGNMQNMVRQFRQFASSFRGDPQQQVQQMLQSGRMSQDQYNRLYQMATQLKNILGG